MHGHDTALTPRQYSLRMTATLPREAPAVTAPVALMTAEELLVCPMPDKRVELVRGRLVVREPPGMRHGQCAARIVVALSNFLQRDRELRGVAKTRGRVFTCDSGFTLARDPDTVRGPDVAYVSRERVAGSVPVGYGEFAPDLAVDIRSPTDRAGAVLAKVGDLLDAGSQLVWVVNPERQQVNVFSADGSQLVLGIEDSLSGEHVLPGFSFALAELFAD